MLEQELAKVPTMNDDELVVLREGLQRELDDLNNAPDMPDVGTSLADAGDRIAELDHALDVIHLELRRRRGAPAPASWKAARQHALSL